tara:strand:- start:3381 stop:4160 length:780 start_codon:yes stop_codon:yes gene_type:complete
MTALNPANLPTRVSFSLYWLARHCTAAGLPRRAVITEVERRTQNNQVAMILGRFFHSVVQAVADERGSGKSQAEAVAGAFPVVVSKYKEKYRDLNLDYEPLVQDVHETVLNHFDLGFDRATRIDVEQELESVDGNLFGEPDWVEFRDEQIHLVDFKLTRDAVRLNTPKNVAQIAYYSHLIMDNYGSLPGAATIAGLRGAQHQVATSPQELRQVSKRASEISERLSVAASSRLQLEDLASPATASCFACRYRAVCEVAAR